MSNINNLHYHVAQPNNFLNSPKVASYRLTRYPLNHATDWLQSRLGCAERTLNSIDITGRRIIPAGTWQFQFDDPTGTDRCAGRSERCRQEYHRRLVVAFLRSRGGTSKKPVSSAPTRRARNRFHFSFVRFFPDLFRFYRIARPERPLAPGTDRRRVTGTDSFRCIDRRQHSIRTRKRHARRACRSRRPSQRPRFHQRTAERNAFLYIVNHELLCKTFEPQ